MMPPASEFRVSPKGVSGIGDGRRYAVNRGPASTWRTALRFGFCSGGDQGFRSFLAAPLAMDGGTALRFARSEDPVLRPALSRQDQAVCAARKRPRR